MSVDLGRSDAEPDVLNDDGSHARPPAKVYDRSSSRGDFLIVIPDQIAEDFELGAPETQFRGDIDGAIFMPSPLSNRHRYGVRFYEIFSMSIA